MVILSGDEQIGAFTDGTIDALYTHTPFLEEALVDDRAVLLINQSAGEVAPLRDGEIHTLAAMRDYAQIHPEVLSAVTRAIARAQDLLHHDPEAALRALAKAGIRDSSPKQLGTIFALYRAAVPATPRVSAAAIERDAILYPARPIMPDFTRVHAADYVP
jgi:ABC-type nitrate/sulfonate/bicarbonate transport system substrate-binding protein